MAKLKEGAATAAAPQTTTRARTPGVAVSNAVPEFGGRRDGASPPPLGDRPAFYICAHPHRWGVIRGQVVPIIKRLRAVRGANGVDEDSKGKPIMSQAIATMVEAGWIVLPFDVDGPGSSYLRKIEQTGGYIDRWTTVYSGTEAETFDEAGFVTWLKSLIDRGVIPSCPSFVLDRLREQIDRRLAKAVERNRPEDAQRIERMKADLAAIDAELALLEPVPVSAESAVPDLG